MPLIIDTIPTVNQILQLMIFKYNLWLSKAPLEPSALVQKCGHNVRDMILGLPESWAEKKYMGADVRTAFDFFRN